MIAKLSTRLYEKLTGRAVPPFFYDYTQEPPASYTIERAHEVYGEAFRRTFEYLSGTGLLDGSVLEFGVFRGFTARLITDQMRRTRSKAKLFLFDSFEGLPAISSPVDTTSYEVAVNKVWYPGQMGLPSGIEKHIRTVLSRRIDPARLQVIKGFYDRTLDAVLPGLGKASLVHIDCDLYESAKFVLERLERQGIFSDGCVLLFDDYNCNRASPSQGERRALAETLGDPRSRYFCSDFFSYGWHGRALFVHERR